MKRRPHITAIAIFNGMSKCPFQTKQVLFLLFVFSCFSFYSQQSPKIAEYEEKLQTTGDVKSKIEILNSLGELYLRTEPSKARKYSLQALDLSSQAANQKGKINSCNTIGNSYYLEGNYPSALDYYLKALKMVEAMGDKKGIANSLMGVGNIYSAQGNYKLSLDYLFKSLKIREVLNDKDGISGCYNNIGVIYMEMEEYEKALEYQQKSLKLKQETGDKKGTSSNLGNIGSIYFQFGNYPLAMEYQLRAYEIRKELNNKKGIAMSLIDIGNIYEKEQKYLDAIHSLESAVKTAKEVGYKVALKGAYLGLSSAYEKIDSSKKALDYYKLFTAIKDSIFNKENSSKLIEMQTRFDSERKEKEITLLTKSQEIQSLQSKHQRYEMIRQKMETEHRKKEIKLKSQELESEKIKSEAKNKEIAIQEEEVKNQRMMRNSIAGGLLFVCILAALLIVGLRQKHKANKSLENKNNEIAEAYQIIETNRNQIAEKNKNITDSINYAKRIQQAILPSKEEMDKSFKEYFVLYTPKDIVSGDFYFHARRDDKIVIAVADCTGHGVPGAFMSMIGNDMLNHIIIENGVTKPSEILNQLNKGVKKALKQESLASETKDGMDIAICLIDIKTKRIEFAGAVRSLYYSSNGIQKVAGDTTSIGGFTHEDYQFNNHQFNLRDEDTLYLFTDGYVDQFGGEKGKKFMTKNLRSLLSDICDMPMHEQQSVLNETFISWKRDNEQVDDILVMGIKL